MFGSSGHHEQPKGLLTENFIHSDSTLNQHVKTFVRPYIVKNIINPHYYIITNSTRCCSGNITKMDVGPFNPQPLPFENSLTYIAHYFIQSEEEYKRRKGRSMDDGTGNKLGMQMQMQIQKMYNDVENTQLKNMYSQRTKEFLQQYNIEL
jgi:hypothetical protein